MCSFSFTFFSLLLVVVGRRLPTVGSTFLVPCFPCLPCLPSSLGPVPCLGRGWFRCLFYVPGSLVWQYSRFISAKMLDNGSLRNVSGRCSGTAVVASNPASPPQTTPGAFFFCCASPSWRVPSLPGSASLCFACFSCDVSRERSVVCCLRFYRDRPSPLWCLV